MIRCCSKLVIPLPSRSGSPVCISRIYVASSNQDFNQRRYASGGSQPPKRFKKVFYTTVGLTLVGVGGVVVYAKSDPKFRKVLDSYIPGTDGFIRIIYQEEGSFNISITEKLSSIQDKVLSLPSEVYKKISGISGEEKTPSVLPKIKELKSEEVLKPKPKLALDTSRKQSVPVEVAGPGDLKPIAEEAIKLYKDIIGLIEGAGDEIIEAIDKLDDTSDQKAWKEIRAKIEEKSKLNDEVDKKLSEAGEKAKQFSSTLKAAKALPDIEPLKKLEEEVQKMKEKAENLKDNKLATSKKYFDKIEETRKRFGDEIATLFPGARLGSGVMTLKDSDIDLFLYYAYQKIQYYQKELNKLETVIAQKLKKAIDSKDDAQAIQAAISSKVEEARTKLKEEYDKKMVELKSGCDEDLNNQMKRQEQIHMDLLNEKLAQKEKEVERKLMQRMEDKVLEEQQKLQAELADMTGRMQGLNKAIATRALQDQKAQTSQALWSAAEALYDTLKHSSDDGKLKPLKENVEAIKKASAKGDDLVETVLATIPKVALDRGVYPEDKLRDRFLKVEKVAWRVAGVPEGGASLGKLMVSWLQSALVIKASEPIPPGELNNEPFDPDSLSNYDIIQRARYWVDRGDFEQALKYMNLLKGGARAIASDWMKEVTTLLETEQAAKLLLAHASASGMIYS